jgi:Zn-dependent peptidase ImmA (M78 family)/transcriptional regulator with XRE-family HTH domain
MTDVDRGPYALHMASSSYAHVTPEVLRWARESTGYSIEDAASKIGVSWSELEAAEEGYDLLTLRQAERAAATYERPLAALFLPAPPSEEPAEAVFRRLPGAPAPPWPPEMVLLSRRVRDRQEAVVELHELLEQDSRWAALVPRLQVADVDALPSVVRKLLGISLEEQTSWQDRSGYTPLRAWVDAVEAVGVFVMQDGSMPLEMMRGFAAPHDVAPAIVANTQDDPRARAFTVVHELGHLVLASNGQRVGPETEEWCEDFAGNVLAPREDFAPAFRRTNGDDLLSRVDQVALEFGITPMAAVVRLGRYGALSNREAGQLLSLIRARGRPREPSGGQYYRTAIGRLGPAFIRLVFTAVEGQALTYPAASRLLGVKVNNFGKLRDHLNERTA